jgi:hypothetical protein
MPTSIREKAQIVADIIKDISKVLDKPMISLQCADIRLRPFVSSLPRKEFENLHAAWPGCYLSSTWTQAKSAEFFSSLSSALERDIVSIDAEKLLQKQKSCVLRMDQPLKVQQTELNAAARKKIMAAKGEIASMQREWKEKFEEKMAEIKSKEELKLCREHSSSKRPRTDPLKYWFDPDHHFSVVKDVDFALRCIKEIRADAKASGDVLPWRECMPSGILSTLPLKEYVQAWIAEEEEDSK